MNSKLKLVSMSGLILDFELTPANCSDLEAGFELLTNHTDLDVLGDKAYISGSKAIDIVGKEPHISSYHSTILPETRSFGSLSTSSQCDAPIN